MTVYLRVDGVDPEDLTAEDADVAALKTLLALEDRGLDVEGVVPYLREDAHLRLVEADTAVDKARDERLEDLRETLEDTVTVACGLCGAELDTHDLEGRARHYREEHAADPRARRVADTLLRDAEVRDAEARARLADAAADAE